MLQDKKDLLQHLDWGLKWSRTKSIWSSPLLQWQTLLCTTVLRRPTVTGNYTTLYKNSSCQNPPLLTAHLSFLPPLEGDITQQVCVITAAVRRTRVRLKVEPQRVSPVDLNLVVEMEHRLWMILAALVFSKKENTTWFLVKQLNMLLSWCQSEMLFIDLSLPPHVVFFLRVRWRRQSDAAARRRHCCWRRDTHTGLYFSDQWSKSNSVLVQTTSQRFPKASPATLLNTSRESSRKTEGQKNGCCCQQDLISSEDPEAAAVWLCCVLLCSAGPQRQETTQLCTKTCGAKTILLITGLCVWAESCRINRRVV